MHLQVWQIGHDSWKILSDMYGVLAVLVHGCRIPFTMMVEVRRIAVSRHSICAPKRIVAGHVLHLFKFVKLVVISLDVFEVIDQVIILSLDSIFFSDVVILFLPGSQISFRQSLEEGVFVIIMGNTKLIFVQGLVIIAWEEPVQVQARATEHPVSSRADGGEQPDCRWSELLEEL